MQHVQPVSILDRRVLNVMLRGQRGIHLRAVLQGPARAYADWDPVLRTSGQLLLIPGRS
jgi:hypothetical protein